MGQDTKATHKRLTQLWRDAAVVDLDIEDGPMAIISDIHLGDGGDADDFHRNEKALLAALARYADAGATVVLLGDIEELWQFDLRRICDRYDTTVYRALRALPAGKLQRVFGNHDIEWGSPPDPASATQRPGGAPEALRLRRGGTAFALLVHGHQGSTDSDRYAWFSRFVVRGVFKPIESLLARVGLYRHPSATKSMVLEDYERVFYAWAKKNRTLVICGHSHRAIFASRAWSDRLRGQLFELRHQLDREANAARVVELRWEITRLERELDEEREKGRDVGQLDPDGPARPCYFNCGCGLYSNGITAIEIDATTMRLVRWSRDGGHQAEQLQSGQIAEICLAVGC